MVKISDLVENCDCHAVKAEAVSDVSAPREVVNRFGKKSKVASVTIKDSSGMIQLNLWNDDIKRVKKGDKIRIDGGWVSSYNGKLQMSIGKYGKMSVNE